MVENTELFEALQRSIYVDYLEKVIRPKYPELEWKFLAINDTLTRKEVFSNELLDELYLAASDSRPVIYHIGTDALGKLAIVDIRAISLIEQMSSQSDARVRHNAILCLNANEPRDWVVSLITKSISDRSARVRMKAADWAGRLILTELEPKISNALSIEKNIEAKNTLLHALGRFKHETIRRHTQKAEKMVDAY